MPRAYNRQTCFQRIDVYTHIKYALLFHVAICCAVYKIQGQNRDGPTPLWMPEKKCTERTLLYSLWRWIQKKKVFSTKHTRIFFFFFFSEYAFTSERIIKRLCATRPRRLDYAQSARIYNWNFIRQFGKNVRSSVLNYNYNIVFLLYICTTPTRCRLLRQVSTLLSITILKTYTNKSYCNAFHRFFAISAMIIE